jgi:sec-independent protein translocase protein TatA
MNLPLAFLDSLLNPTTMLIVMVLAILLYGERLPEVARTWGKQLIDLKKSVQGLRDQFESVAREVTSTMDQPLVIEPPVAREEATAPKFEPPPAEPAVETTTTTTAG